MNEEHYKRIVCIAATLIITATFFYAYLMVDECRDAGGVVVKGLFGLECITR